MSSTNQVAGVYRRRVGDALITVVNDGFLDVPLDILHGAERDEFRSMLRDAFAPSVPRIPVNAFVVETAGEPMLIDAGGGTTTVYSMGRLLENLAAAGFQPEDFKLVLLTHIHPDHSSGLLNADGAPIFPRAEIVVHGDEFDFWNDQCRATEKMAAAAPYLQSAGALLEAYRGRFRLSGGGPVAPGISLLPLPGHTPGHSGYEIASAGEAMLIWGDTVHIPELQIPRPQVTSEFDISRSRAAESRERLFRHVAQERILVTGGHLHLPGFAHLVSIGDSYRLVPEAWKVSI